MRQRSPDSDDIERAVYDGMQDLRVPHSTARPRPKSSRKTKPKRRARRRG
jgi:hypothetical protein